MDDLTFVLIAFLLVLVISLNFLVELDEQLQQTINNELENYEIIELMVNTTRSGNNNYIVIMRNLSGDYIERSVDINTFIKYGGEI